MYLIYMPYIYMYIACTYLLYTYLALYISYIT
jgi:hypothetical protein